MNAKPWVVFLPVITAVVCSCRTAPPPAREYEVEYYIEIDGKIVQRVRGKAREIIPKEPLK